MKKLFLLSSVAALTIAAIILTESGCTSNAGQPTATTAPAAPAAMTPDQMVEHGHYLVMVGGCNDCHSPKVMTEHGPIVDSTKTLAGSPDGMKLAFIDNNTIAPGKWYLGAPDLTAWAGPWGVSYSANLTPDTATGIGIWTDEMFIKIIRSGKYMGIESGRPIMPPMPWDAIGRMTDQDLKCIFAYLKSLPPIHNKVHEYVPPPAIAALNAMK